MGGRGGSSGISASGNSVMTLNNKIKSIDKKMESIGKKMEIHAKYAMPGQDYDSKKAKGYYNLKSQYEKLRSSKRQLSDKLATEKRKSNSSTESQKTFVNSFDEATKREITSQTYKRQQNRQSKEIMSFIGGKNRK